MKETTDHDIPFRCPLTTNENTHKKRGRKEIVMQIVLVYLTITLVAKLLILVKLP